jgi:hypothetical protein
MAVLPDDLATLQLTGRALDQSAAKRRERGGAMMEPEDPVILFADDCLLWWVGDPSLGAEQIESSADFAYGYDGLARPLALKWVDGVARLEVSSDEPKEAQARQHVRAFYVRYSRLGLEPPEEADFRTFLEAVADD